MSESKIKDCIPHPLRKELNVEREREREREREMRHEGKYNNFKGGEIRGKTEH